MREKTYQVWVFNTFTSQYELCPVAKDQYDAVRRTVWNIEDSDARFKAHNTVFSDMRGGTDGALENFHEFIDESQNPQNHVLQKERLVVLRTAIHALPPIHRRIIELIYLREPPLSTEEVAALFGITKRAVNKRRQAAERILIKKYRFFENNGSRFGIFDPIQVREEKSSSAP